MIQDVIAIRYAKALAAAAAEKNELARTRQDVERLADILDPNIGDISVPELLDFLMTPTVSLQEKLDMTDVLCEKLEIGKLVSEFLNVLIRHRRVQLASRIMRYYASIAAEIEDVYEALVYSAKPLTDSDRGELAQALEKKLGKKVRMMVGVHRDLVAGVKVKVGDLFYDDTVRGRMERFTRTLRRL